MDVKTIPIDVQCLLSASAKVNNYKRAVEELVYNSLDAESTCIAIRIHVQNSWIQVVDNGSGIKRADYTLLGERYATSKLLDVDTLKAVPTKYGYQGQALANIIEMSQTVRITSRCSNSNNTWVKTFLGGKIERECFKTALRPSKGTTVEINGFLYNLNIRKKYINPFNELQDIRMFLEQLLLLLNNVSISLRDESENEIVFKMHKSRDIYQTFKSLFGIDSSEVQELQVEKNEYKVKAFIGTEKGGIKHYNWIYLNNKFVNISNLHKILYTKFTKSNLTKRTKKKITGANNEENSNICQFVPFYFLFITCPYYDYDIVESGKHNDIKFKDWLQINNLIEKLVKFYNGDTNLMYLQNNDNQKLVSKKAEDTRNEVKKIIEKILGKPNKIPRVSQIQNGIKGKQAKRRKKKQQMDISLTKIFPSKNNAHNKDLDNSKIKLKNNFITKVTSKHYDSNIQLKSTRKQLNIKHKTKKNYFGISNFFLRCKCKNKYDNIIEMFKNNSTYSNKKRCDELSYDKKTLNTKNCEEIKNTFISITPVKNKCLVTERKQDKCPVKNHETYVPIISPDILEFKSFSNDKKLMITEKIRSYDLLQTVIKTQQSFYDRESRKQDKFITINGSNGQQRTHTKTYCHAPTLTFESHKYNMNSLFIENILPPIVPFISKESRNNFNIGIENPREYVKNKTGKITKHHSLFHTKKRNNNHISKFNRLLNKNKWDGLPTPFSIDISETDITEFSKQIRNQVMNDMNSLLHHEDCDKRNSPKTQLNFGVNLNIESTYTILMDSFYNLEQALNVHKSRRTFINETVNYINVSYHDTIHGNHANKTLNEIFISQPQHTPKLNTEEPLDICEAILNSQKNIQDDFNNSFDIIPRFDPSPVDKESNNINELLQENISTRSQINNFENNTFLRENSIALVPIEYNEETNETAKANSELLNEIRYKYEKSGTDETKYIQESSVYNFKLNTRHRFMPKGMSQIFKNCFSKNICSYNLDTEYYDDTIYKNFVEDVVVNSEIFEPKVQNLKEITTGDIQKVNEKLKKHKADLKFGIDSLRCAKVILGQVDSKFVAAIVSDMSETNESPHFLVFFDQHAVHERIMLERNLSYYITENNWRKVTIDTISLNSSKDEILYLHNHKDKFTRFGLEWTVSNKSEILMNAIPEAIRGKNPRSMETIIKAVKDLILEQTHAIKYLKGNVSLYPQSIMSLVFSEACRYAIKFGDILSMRECVELIAALANCKTPFQCAHGRPVMAVMVELKNEKIEYKASMENIKQFKNRIKK